MLPMFSTPFRFCAVDRDRDRDPWREAAVLLPVELLLLGFVVFV
jgi:hypothetical protein